MVTQGTHYKGRGGWERVSILQAQAMGQGHFTRRVSQRLLLSLLEISRSKKSDGIAPLSLACVGPMLCLEVLPFRGPLALSLCRVVLLSQLVSGKIPWQQI